MPSGIYPRTKEHIRHMSEAILALDKEDSSRIEHIREAKLGSSLSREHCRHISESMRALYKGNSKLSRDASDRMSKTMQRLRNDPNGPYGENYSQKVSQTMKEWWKDPDFARRVSEGISKALTGRTLSEEHKRHLSESKIRSGDGGTYGYGWVAIRELILDRDNYTCQGCGARFLKLVVHHIDSNKDNIDQHNLITTCYSCNVKADYDREYWIAFYREKIAEIYKVKSRMEVD